MTIVKRFGVDFESAGGALTLDPSEVCSNGEDRGKHTKLHNDGWEITGVVQEDYFVWVNYFEANHPKYGRVWGDFEEEVFADSEEGFKNFYDNHAPEAWDYYDI